MKKWIKKKWNHYKTQKKLRELIIPKGKMDVPEDTYAVKYEGDRDFAIHICNEQMSIFFLDNNNTQMIMSLDIKEYSAVQLKEIIESYFKQYTKHNLKVNKIESFIKKTR